MQPLGLEICIVMWLNLDLLPCTVTGSWIDLDLHLTGSWVPGYMYPRGPGNPKVVATKTGMVGKQTVHPTGMLYQVRSRVPTFLD